MSKPLDLKVYPPIGSPDQYCLNCDGRGCMGCVFRQYDHDCRNDCPDCCTQNFPISKRFTDAELCAEFEAARCDWMLTKAIGDYWSPLGDGWSHDPQSVMDRTTTLLRFATANHYDEVTR